MNQLRWDPTLREWVAYATHRQDRTFLPPAEYCPLCPTKPGGFPTEVPREHYDIVVFENRFPSFAPNASDPDEGSSDLTPTAPGRGICEVVLYSDDHGATLATMSERRIGNLIEVWADRYKELGANEEVDYVFIFENKGEAIGVTLHHPHGQIYGYPFIPPRPAKELEAAREYRSQNENRCLHCDLLSQEHEDARRILTKGEHFHGLHPVLRPFPVRGARLLPALRALHSGPRQRGTPQPGSRAQAAARWLRFPFRFLAPLHDGHAPGAD